MEIQLTLAMMNDELGQARTSKKEFLDKIERIIPWDTFIGIIEPCYYKGERENKPYPLELMLRIFLLQNLYDLADMRIMTEVILPQRIERRSEIRKHIRRKRANSGISDTRGILVLTKKADWCIMSRQFLICFMEKKTG